MLSAFERGLGKGDEIARASRAGDDAAFRSSVDAALDSLTQAQASAAAYGLSECARLWPSRPIVHKTSDTDILQTPLTHTRR
jgi:hypothetical protein